MKNFKKPLSILTAVVMVLLLFSVVPVMQASATTPGDVWSINAVPDSTNFYTRAYITRESNGSSFGVHTNKGKGFGDRGVMLANSLTTEVVSASTTYRVQFDVWTWYTQSQLKIDAYTGTDVWHTSSSATTITGLSSITTSSWNDGDGKHNFRVVFDITTPSGITGNQHIMVSVVTTDGADASDANLRFRNITIKQKNYFNVIDNDNDELLGTVNATDGDNVMDVLAENGYEKYSYTLSSDVSTIAKTTKEIRVTYTPPEGYIQNIKFDSTYGGVSVADNMKWHYYSTSSGHHLNITNGKITLISGQDHIPDQGDSSVPEYCFTLANNYTSSGLVAGSTYSVQFELTSAAAISSHAADVRFGQDEWTSIVSGANVRYDGTALKNMVVATADAGGGKTTYTLSMSVTLPETGWQNECRNILLSVYCGVNQQYTIDNVVIVPKDKEVFGGHSLVLNDAIGVSFLINRGDLSAEEIADSYVTFEISNSEALKRVDTADATIVGNKYMFTCYLSSVQMAEDVTPTFCAGTGDTFEGSSYSVKRYIDFINENRDSFPSYTVALANAIGNYGYHAQQYFASKKTFTALAASYAVSYASDSYDTVNAAVAPKAFTGANGLDGIEFEYGGASNQFQYNLNFDTTTSVLVKFNSANVHFDSITKADGSNFDDKKNAYTANEVTLYLLHLKVSQLSDVITISGTIDGGEFTLPISGLSYVYGVLNNASATAVAKNIACSLYYYHDAAIKYVNKIDLDTGLDMQYI